MSFISKNFGDYCGELFHEILWIISEVFENQFQKISKISRNTSDIIEKYLAKFQEIFSKRISNNILETFENCFGISWENLGKFREIFQEVLRNTAEILEKYFKNFENYCGEYGEIFHKIILSVMFENHIKKFRTFSRRYFGNYCEIISKKSFE